jgi:tetratricopeptide (TPR) repeat protein
MKKIILSMLLVMAVTTTFAQKANVSKAKNKALMENPDFAGARELIKLALVDPTTKDLSSTWNIAGLIGYKENEALSNKQLLGQKIDNDVKGKAILESYDYYIKAYELDGLPDAKGKIKAKLQKDIKSKIKEYYVQNQNLIAYGAHLFENKKYEETIKVFDIYLGIPKLPMMADEIKLDSNYYMIKYYNAIAATNAEKSEKAIKLYTELTNEGYQELQVHQLLYEEYYKLKDTVNYVKVLKAGFEKFPKEAWFLQNLINYYIFTNQSKEALTYLNNAIESEPGIAQYYYVKGNLTESMGMIEEAQAAFDKSLELDPNSADSYAGIGRLKYNQAVKMSDKANEIKDNKLYNAAKDKADLVFKESIPFFKKAVELNPKEMEYKRTLKTLYYRLQMDKEFEALQKEMGEK